jgi:DNA repair protein radc
MESKSINVKETDLIKERALNYGVDVLTNKELLTILTTKHNKEEIDKLIENEQDIINFFANNSADLLINLFGRNAFVIKSVMELYRRRAQKREYKITQPRDASEYLMQELSYLKKEVLAVLYLNTKNIVIGKEIVSMGSINSSIVHPREIFIGAIKNSSASIIVAHNHPSGDPSPSSEDINITHRLKDCGKLLGIELLDHIIIGDGRYVSLKEKGII